MITSFLHSIEQIDVTKKYKWIGIALFIKLLVLCYLIYEAHEAFSEKIILSFILKENDYLFHLRPVDTYFDTGCFSFIDCIPFAGRIPGYSLPYFLLRLVFSQALSLQLLIIIQMTLSAISVYYLSLIAYKLSNQKNAAFLITFFLYSFSLYYARFDFSTITESLSISTFIFFLYYFLIGLDKKSYKHLLYAGAWLSWAIFLRPFLGYLLIPASLILLYEWNKNFRGLEILRGASIFCISFLIIESAWVVRNAIVLKKFIPLETSIQESYGNMYPETWISTRAFLKKNGIVMAEFEPNSIGEWFTDSELTSKEVKNYSFPDRLFKNVSYNIDSFIYLREQVLIAKESPKNAEKTKKEVLPMIERYEEQYKKGNPLDYYILNPLRNMSNQIFNSGSSYVLLPPFQDMSFFQKVVKLYASAMYYFILSFGLIGVLVVSFKKKQRTHRLFNVLIITHIFLLPILLSLVNAPGENRYLFTIYPILLVFTTLFITDFIFGKKHFQFKLITFQNKKSFPN